MTKSDDVWPGTVSIAAAHDGRYRQGGQHRSMRTWRIAASVVVSLSVAWFLMFGRVPLLSRSLLFSAQSKQEGVEETPKTGQSWSWSDIEPSRKLVWHPCDDAELDCARLDVPMDWLDPSDEERVVLAVIRLKATETTDYKGPVLFNPGGPGGSGVWSLKDHGHLIQTIVGPNHDIISFDPRGISASVPRIDCWGGSPGHEHLWGLKDVGLIDAHPGVLNDAYVRAAAFARTCETHMMSSSNLLRHISTASHARDMLEILLQTGHDKLRYWGFSYGTILGGVFAAMYPDRVERLVSDGNVDYREWHNDAHINFLRDSDKVMQAFYDFCHGAGPLVCVFYAETPAAIQQRLANVLEAIRQRPLMVEMDEHLGPEMPQIITWSHVKQFIARTLYQPNLMFAKFAAIVLALEKGDARPFYEFVHSESGGATELICSVETAPPTVPQTGEEGTGDAFPVIACADHPPLTETVEEFAEWADRAMAISTTVGDVNSLSRLACVGWRVRPKWRFDGPFEAKTNHPILYVANMADNVTPLISARNNSQGFEGSRVLVQNAYGHTTLAAPSACTAAYIRAYFQNGTLPDEGTRCDPDYYPFDQVKYHGSAVKIVEEEDEDELARASRQLSYGAARFGFVPRVRL